MTEYCENVEGEEIRSWPNSLGCPEEPLKNFEQNSNIIYT